MFVSCVSFMPCHVMCMLIVFVWQFSLFGVIFMSFSCEQPYESWKPSTTPPSSWSRRQQQISAPLASHIQGLPSWSSRERITALTVALAWNSGDCETEAAYVQSQPISCVWKHRQCPGWQASTLLADELWLTMPPCPRVSKHKKSALRTNYFFLHSGGLGGKNKNTANTAAYWKARLLSV